MASVSRCQPLIAARFAAGVPGRPPRHEHGVVGGREVDVPVDLRGDVVEPLLAHPAASVGVQVVARHWHDHVVLAVMAALEARFRDTQEYPLRQDLPVKS